MCIYYCINTCICTEGGCKPPKVASEAHQKIEDLQKSFADLHVEDVERVAQPQCFAFLPSRSLS